MSASVIAAIAVFGVLFIAWVILPSRLRKHHTEKIGGETEMEE